MGRGRGKRRGRERQKLGEELSLGSEAMGEVRRK